MGLITPAPISLPYVGLHELDGAQTTVVLGAQDHSPSITVVAGIDLCNFDFQLSSIAQVQFVSAPQNPVTFFQGQVYATSQAVFQWRGELPVFTTDFLQVVVAGGRWGVALWGAVIPNATIQP
jgi:hypothetical protein